MEGTKGNSLMKGAMVLTLAAFIAKLLSAVYRVPFQNLVGDKGFYVYQQIYPIYGLAMTLALSSIPQFLSKILVGKSPKEKRELAKAYFPFISLLSMVTWLVLMATSGLLAFAMGSQELAPLIRIVSFTFLLVPILSIYRGSFQGELLMIPTGVSQVVEQFIRVGVILLAAFGFKLLGWNVYQVSEWALTGSIAGGMVAWIILAYYGQTITFGQVRLRNFLSFTFPNKSLRSKFYREAGMLTIYSGLLILFQLIDSFSVANGLSLSGIASNDAQVFKGIYDRGQPLVQLGLVLSGALSASFLPALTNYISSNREEKFQLSAHMYLRLTVSTSLAASVGLAWLMPFMNYTLFKDFKGTSTLIVFVFSIGLMATIQAFQSVDQSRDKVLASFKAAFVGCLVKVSTTLGCTYLFGIMGASISTLLGLLAVLLTFLHFDEKHVHRFWTERIFGWRLIGALGSMALALTGYGFFWFWIIGNNWQRWETLLISLGGVLLGGCIFIASAVQFKVLTIREWLYVPLGKKLLRVGAKK